MLCKNQFDEKTLRKEKSNCKNLVLQGKKNLIRSMKKPCHSVRKNRTSTKTVTSSRHNIQGMVYNVPNPASHVEHMPARVHLCVEHKLMP